MRTLIAFTFLFYAFLLYGQDSMQVRFVKLEGKKQFYRLAGKGKPTVVFLTGLGVEMEDFDGLQREISKTNKTFVYDRAGIGRSEYLSKDRSLSKLSSELHELLLLLNIEEPFILVGHSRGGALCRYYANKFPGSLAGMVLIDPALPEFRWKRRALRTETDKISFDNYYKSFYADTAKYPEIVKDEFRCFSRDSADMATTPFPSSIPVTILASLKTSGDKYSAGDNAVKKEALLSYSKSAKNIKYVFTEKSGHYIHDDEPELVLKEIKEVIEKCLKQK